MLKCFVLLLEHLTERETPDPDLMVASFGVVLVALCSPMRLELFTPVLAHNQMHTSQTAEDCQRGCLCANGAGLITY
jgi:hypothetical protein